VIVDGERCKGCELCIQVCRSGAIGVATSLNSKGYHAVRVAAGKKCSGCALCALMCPEAAIEIAVEEGA
jgi:2-oxoglutarate ferredoxin oxidoreductase subunit delta